MPRVLLIHSDPSVGELLKLPFSEQKYELQTVQRGDEGLALALAKSPSLILLGTELPDQPGLDVFRTLRSRARTSHIPIMFLAPRSEANKQNDLLQAGADDFIMTPFDADILSLRVRNAINRAARDGLHHPQTGLATGRLITERVRALADEFGWYKIDLDIDHFAAFRDNYGFMTGQEVILYTAEVVRDAVQAAGTPDDFIGHRSDTEFMIVTTLTNGPAVRQQLESKFNDGVLSFYNFMEREQGYIQAAGSDGATTQHPLMKAKIKVQEGEPE